MKIVSFASWNHESHSKNILWPLSSSHNRHSLKKPTLVDMKYPDGTAGPFSVFYFSLATTKSPGRSQALPTPTSRRVDAKPSCSCKAKSINNSQRHDQHKTIPNPDSITPNLVLISPKPFPPQMSEVRISKVKKKKNLKKIELTLR